ncbi:MAG: radical SAM protein [Candidatus Omnitrophica bacterium]|nr:radical SAM protein [Candidatus Omnitrophota bacterium]
MGAIPPLNLCYVAATVRQAGHEVDLIDVQVEEMPFEDLIARIREYNPDLLGFTITTYLFHPVLEWIKAIKNAIGIPVLAGGFHMCLYPAETMVHSAIDYGVIGDRVETILAFLENFAHIERYKDIPGLCYRCGDTVTINPRSLNDTTDFRTIPFPARDLLKNERYGNFICKRKNFTVMLTGTGCPFQCKYCASTLSHCVMRSPENVVDEIEECYNKYGIREIDFYDQSFTIDRKRTLKICEEIIRRKIKIIWTIRTRADLIDEELLVVMKAAGMYRVMYGIESGDQRILDRLNKNEDIEDIKRVIYLTKKHKLQMLGFFMLGCPGEDNESLKNTIDFALSMPFDDIQVTRFTLFPGTAFYNEYRERTGAADYWADYVLDRKNVKRLPLFDTSFPPEDMEREVKRLYLRFYLRPKIILRKVFSHNIITSFTRYGKALCDMVIN